MDDKYVICEEGESQYDEYDLQETNIVDAVYVKAILDIDRGNPYIEALPSPRNDKGIMAAYTRRLPGYSFDKVKDMSKLDKMVAVGTLREIRFPLPFNKDLEFAMYNALLTSYRSRRQVKSDNSHIDIAVDNVSKQTNTVLYGDSSEATSAGFSLIGYSGCGKSSSISNLVHYYPQVIMHNDEGGGYFPQIVYLVVNCVPNSNFAALYEGIGDAIDKALNNITPVYAKAISRATGLGKKAELVKNYVELFGIGIIIFDEIQLLDFSHTRENTFDSLLTLANRTKVAVAVVGTEDAREKMFKELRTTRRVGMLINGNLYCENKEYFAFLVKNLFRYQWFDEMVPVTGDLVDALYEVTKGIVDQLIGVYSCMHYDYLSKKKKPKINADYVRTVANKFYPGIQDVLANLESTDNTAELQVIRNEAEDMVNALISSTKQQAEMQKIMRDTNRNIENIQLSNVTANIRALYDEYSDEKIEIAFDKVIARKSSEGKTEKEISRLVIEHLQKVPKRINKKNKIEKPDLEHMRSFLDIKEE